MEQRSNIRPSLLGMRDSLIHGPTGAVQQNALTARKQQNTTNRSASLSRRMLKQTKACRASWSLAADYPANR